MLNSISSAGYRLLLRLVKEAGPIGDLVVVNMIGEAGPHTVAGTVSVSGPNGASRLHDRFELPSLSTESYRHYRDVFGSFGEHVIMVSVEDSDADEPTPEGENIAEDGSGREGPHAVRTVEMGGSSPTGVVFILVRRVDGSLRADIDIVKDPDVAADTSGKA